MSGLPALNNTGLRKLEMVTSEYKNWGGGGGGGGNSCRFEDRGGKVNEILTYLFNLSTCSGIGLFVLME